MKNFQNWQIGPHGENYFKISLVQDDDADTLRFHIQYEGQEMEIDMHEMFCKKLLKQLDEYLDLLARIRKSKEIL